MTTWGPVRYACHDPPMLAYQSATLEDFLLETVAMWQAESADPALRAFADSLPPTALVVDLRHPQLGQGFSWGRFGPRTAIRRAGEERIWALMPPERKPGLFATLFGGRRGSA
jgi:hypothetical protein